MLCCSFHTRQCVTPVLAPASAMACLCSTAACGLASMHHISCFRRSLWHQKKINRKAYAWKITAHLRRSTNDATPPPLSNQMQAPPPPPPVLTVAEGNSNVFLPACSPTAPSYLPLLLSFFFVHVRVKYAVLFVSHTTMCHTCTRASQRNGMSL